MPQYKWVTWYIQIEGKTKGVDQQYHVFYSTAILSISRIKDRIEASRLGFWGSLNHITIFTQPSH